MDAESPKLRSLPEADLPRERLTALGRAALSDEELIAIFLRTGLPGCNVLELATRLKRKAGSLAALGGMEAKEIAALLGKGIGPAKAATLAAVFELGQRAAREALETADMSSAAKVYEYLAGELRYEPQEHMVLLLLDAKHRIIRRVSLGKGTLTRVQVHPRDVFREAVRHSASSFIMAHNHPSGDPSPSRQDEELTKRINEASQFMGIRLLDHVIIGSPSPQREKPYFSFAEHQMLD